MSREQKERLIKYIDTAGRWVNAILLSFGLWFLNEVYTEFKDAKKDIEAIKRELSTISTKVDFIERYELKSKR